MIEKETRDMIGESVVTPDDLKENSGYREDSLDMPKAVDVPDMWYVLIPPVLLLAVTSFIAWMAW